jgi:hypothetical protein
MRDLESYRYSNPLGTFSMFYQTFLVWERGRALITDILEMGWQHENKQRFRNSVHVEL